ncbi:MAG: oligosaccharide flippase family protein [Desulfobaccales bacterium]|jgi:O-antigen/teichoic acid export membrane protein
MTVSSNTKGFISCFIANLSIQVCNIATGILAARLLLPIGRGELATVILWPVILECLGELGASWVFAREAAANPDKESDLARTAVVLGLTLGCLMMILGYYLIPYLLPSDKQNLSSLSRIYLLRIPFNYVATFLLFLDQGRMRWTRFNLTQFVMPFSYFVFIILFWGMHYINVNAFIMAFLLSILVAATLRIFLQRDQIWRGRTNISMCSRIMRLGIPFFIASISIMVAGQVDKAMAVDLLPMEMVGFYAAALTFASAHISLGSALAVTSFILLANETSPERQAAFLSKIFRQSTWLYIIAGSGVALLAPIFIVLLFGPKFQAAVKPAIILAAATSLTGLGNVLNEGLRGMGIAYPGAWANLLGGGLVALGAWYLIPHFGLMGIAGGMVIGALGRLIILMAIMVFLLKISLSQLWGLKIDELKALWERIYQLMLAVKR